MTQIALFVKKYYLWGTLFLFLFTGCGGLPPEAQEALAPLEEAASEVAQVVAPTFDELPTYPNTFGVPEPGVYQEPITGVSPYAWTDFPPYPDNFTLNPLDGNPGNCGHEGVAGWTLCAYAFGWQVSLVSPDSMVGVYISPSNRDGYMRVDYTIDNGATFDTRESQTVVISDGVNILSIHATVTFTSTTYQYGFFVP